MTQQVFYQYINFVKKIGDEIMELYQKATKYNTDILKLFIK